MNIVDNFNCEQFLMKKLFAISLDSSDELCYIKYFI